MLAIEDGVVSSTPNDPDGYGLQVWVKFIDKSGNVKYQQSAHLSNNSIVKEGDPVCEGDIIGVSGNTGNAGNVISEEHVHIGIWDQTYATKGIDHSYDPANYFYIYEIPQIILPTPRPVTDEEINNP